MMTQTTINDLKKWFTAYADGFIARVKEPAPYILKKEHTFRVCVDEYMNTFVRP